MPAGKITPPEIREQILNLLKRPYPRVPGCSEFGLSDGIIWTDWRGKASSSPGLVGVSSLKRKNWSLYLLIGLLIAQLSDEKKRTAIATMENPKLPPTALTKPSLPKAWRFLLYYHHKRPGAGEIKQQVEGGTRGSSEL